MASKVGAVRKQIAKPTQTRQGFRTNIRRKFRPGRRVLYKSIKEHTNFIALRKIIQLDVASDDNLPSVFKVDDIWSMPLFQRVRNLYEMYRIVSISIKFPPSIDPIQILTYEDYEDVNTEPQIDTFMKQGNVKVLQLTNQRGGYCAMKLQKKPFFRDYIKVGLTQAQTTGSTDLNSSYKACIKFLCLKPETDLKLNCTFTVVVQARGHADVLAGD